MKKTILQMVLTCFVLGVILLAGDPSAERSSEQPKTEAEVSAQITGGAAAVFGENDAVRLPIIMYHSILKDKAQAGKFVLSPVALAADLDYLSAHGYETIQVRDLVRYADGLADLPPKPIMLTFDDGFFNNYQYAYPLLKERGMKAVISVIGTEIERFTESGQENTYWSYLTADRLREMQQDGVFEIQNHSYDLHENEARRGCLRMRGENLKSYRALLLADTERVQTFLSRHDLPLPTAYAYPFGMYSRETEEIIQSLGFLCTMTHEEKINTIRRDQESLYRLGRFGRPAGISSGAFFGGILEE